MRRDGGLRRCRISDPLPPEMEGNLEVAALSSRKN